MSYFIDKDQTLLALSDHGSHGLEWMGHPELTFPTVEHAARAFSNGNELQFLVLTPGETMIVDVTEDIAEAYLKHYSGTTPADEHAVPRYVHQSRAWSTFCDDWQSDDDDGFHDPTPPYQPVYARNGSVM